MRLYMAEIEKINYYIEEAKRLWPQYREKVLEKGFYELWENVQEPKPFSVSGNKIEFLGKKFKLTGGVDLDRFAYFSWDTDESCPCLVIESEIAQEKLVLQFGDNCEPQPMKGSVVLNDDEQIGRGELLEMVFHVITSIHQHDPHKNILKLSKKEFLTELEFIESNYAPEVVSAARQMSAKALKALINQAARDMALDELSGQLSLPLNGSYAATSMLGDAEEETTKEVVVPRRTGWQIGQELDMFVNLTKFQDEFNQTFTLPFENAVILNRSHKNVVLQVPASPEMPVREGDRFLVYLKGDRRSVGKFWVDIFQGDTIYGHYEGDEFGDGDAPPANMFALPPKGQELLLAEEMEALTDHFVNERQQMISMALMTALGVEEATITIKGAEKSPEGFDSSQSIAWASAVNDKNPIVLIQGPPGTGKTHVLEQVVRHFVARKKRVLVAAPSNTAVDNICRRVIDLPVLRLSLKNDNIAPDIADTCWAGDEVNVHQFLEKRGARKQGGVYAGTHVGLTKSRLIKDELEQNGLFDVIIFDEAGMARVEEFMLCADLAKRSVLFGDHQQLPPFPIPDVILKKLEETIGVLNLSQKTALTKSALEWLVTRRGFPVITLERSYRCQNPRLLRFSSTLFYDARVKTSELAEYFRLPYHEREAKYPPSTLRLYKTSNLPPAQRGEKIIVEGKRPGLENPLEARVCVHALLGLLDRYPLNEITVIAPYRRQIRLIKNLLLNSPVALEKTKHIPEEEWKRFVNSRVATVDSFQGGESDVVIISYVRSGGKRGVGFVDDPNRVNVAHTRCRKEMIIVADIDYLRRYSENDVFHRMERAFQRDGEEIIVTADMVKEVNTGEPVGDKPVFRPRKDRKGGTTWSFKPGTKTRTFKKK